MTGVSDYQLWKAACLIRTRRLLYEIVQTLVGDILCLEVAEESFQKKYINNLTSEDLCRFCLYDILIKLRNKECETFSSKLRSTYNKLGFTEIEDILH